MKEKILKIIMGEVESQLDEYDFDGAFDKLSLSKRAKEIIHEEIVKVMSDKIRMRILIELQKHTPIIDASVAAEAQKIIDKFEMSIK